MKDNCSFKSASLMVYMLLFISVNGQQSKSSYSVSDSLCFSSPVLLNCKIQLPDNFNQDIEYPMIIGLHGGGGSYEKFIGIWERFENPKFIFATPEAPYKWLLNGEMGYDWAGWPSGNLTFMQEAVVLTSKYIENLIAKLKTRYNVSDVYLLGFSQGSIIAQVAGINNHELLNGLIILSGPEPYYPDKPEIIWPDEEAIRNANKLRIFISHGKSDPLVESETAVNSQTLYEKYGFEVTLFEFDGGHEITSQVLMNINNWLTESE